MSKPLYQMLDLLLRCVALALLGALLALGIAIVDGGKIFAGLTAIMIAFAGIVFVWTKK